MEIKKNERMLDLNSDTIIIKVKWILKLQLKDKYCNTGAK